MDQLCHHRDVALSVVLYSQFKGHRLSYRMSLIDGHVMRINLFIFHTYFLNNFYSIFHTCAI